jgi:hypothetical protein
MSHSRRLSDRVVNVSDSDSDYDQESVPESFHGSTRKIPMPQTPMLKGRKGDVVPELPKSDDQRVAAIPVKRAERRGSLSKFNLDMKEQLTNQSKVDEPTEKPITIFSAFTNIPLPVSTSISLSPSRPVVSSSARIFSALPEKLVLEPLTSPSTESTASTATPTSSALFTIRSSELSPLSQRLSVMDIQSPTTPKVGGFTRSRYLLSQGRQKSVQADEGARLTSVSPANSKR